MRATTAMPTRAGIEILFTGQPAQLKSLGHILADGFLHLMHFLLSVHESFRDGIIDQRVAMLFEFGDLIIRERKPHLLFVLQRLAFLHHELVLRLGAVIGHERVDATADGLKFGLFDNGLAELAGFLRNERFLNICLHNFICKSVLPEAGPASSVKYQRLNTSRKPGIGNPSHDEKRNPFLCRQGENKHWEMVPRLGLEPRTN